MGGKGFQLQPDYAKRTAMFVKNFSPRALVVNFDEFVLKLVRIIPFGV